MYLPSKIRTDEFESVLPKRKKKKIPGEPGIFKQCKKCGSHWKTRSDFLNDTGITLVGYQVNFEELVLGIFLFNHTCKTTIALNAGLFTDLYDGPVFQARTKGEEECPGFCLKKENLSPCPARCECAFVRETIQIIKRMSRYF